MNTKRKSRIHRVPSGRRTGSLRAAGTACVTGLLAGWVLLTVPAAHAQIYTSEGSFLAASGALDMESFECFADTPVDSAFPVVAPAFTMTITPGFGSTRAPMSIYTNPAGSAHATDGRKLVLAGALPTTNGAFILTITLAAPVTEFGMWITDFGDWTAGSLSISTSSGDGTTIATNPPTHPDGEERFIGIRNGSAPFSIVTLLKSTQGDGIGIDQVYYSNLAPEVCVHASVGGEPARASWSRVKTLSR